MKKIVVSIFVAALGSYAAAQNIGNSPYAAYGIGDIKYDNSVETRSMGGISTAYVWDFNNQFNFQNPAANQNLEITSLRFHGTNENQYFKSGYNGNKYGKHSSYLSGISLAFPLSKKVKLGIGYQPYSSKDYSITQSTSLPDGTAGVQNFHGDGGINLVQLGVGYSITPSFSVGLSNNLYFGRISDVQETAYENTTLVSNIENESSVTSFNFTLGSVYQKKLKNNKKLTLGASYTFGNTSDFKSTYTNSTYFLNGTTKSNEDIVAQESKNTNNTIPQKLSLGVGFGHDAKWFVSGQFDYKSGKNTESLRYLSYSYDNAYRVSVGGWYLPNYNNFRNYFSRVTYRYGAFYEKGHLNVQGTNINQYGLSFGASLPFQKSNVTRLSTLDLGIELGQRGTVKNNLIRENFLNFTIGINFANKWFEKQYFD